MKRTFLLFLLIFQIAFSQEVIIKGKAHNSGTFPNRTVTIIINDTINKFRKYNDLLYEKATRETPDEKKDIFYHLNNLKIRNAEFDKLYNNKNYVIKTDSLGNFEIKAKITDSLCFESYWHTTKKFLIADLIKKKKINISLELEPCEVWPKHPEKPTKLYVFIGKKIKTWNSPSGYCNVGALTSRILSKYLVVKNIYGDFKKDTIHFTTYPPHSAPIQQNYVPFKTFFADFEYCLLYVLEYKGELLQMRFVFDDIYPTKEGKWASPLKPKGLYHTISPDLDKLKKINFVTPIEFTYDERFENQIKQNFPENYNSVSDGKITVNYGYYVEDLFEIRKTGALKEFNYLIK